MACQAEAPSASFLGFLLKMGLQHPPRSPHLSSFCGGRSGQCGSLGGPCPTALQKRCSVDPAEESLERYAQVRQGPMLSETLQYNYSHCALGGKRVGCQVLCR